MCCTARFAAVATPASSHVTVSTAGAAAQSSAAEDSSTRTGSLLMVKRDGTGAAVRGYIDMNGSQTGGEVEKK